MANDKVIVYGAPWCPDCRRAKQFLGEQRVPYSWVDIDDDEEGRSYEEITESLGVSSETIEKTLLSLSWVRE